VVRVRVLGPLEITDDAGDRLTVDELPRRVRQVLGVLAARYDRPQTKDALADAVWGDALPANHGAALEHYISVIRRRLQPGRRTSESFIMTRAGGYMFSAARADLDLAELRALLRLADSQPLGSADRLRLRQELLDLVVDLPFVEDEHADWAVGCRTEVRDAMLASRLELAESALAEDPGRALRLADDAVQLDSYVERPYQIAMRASVALGRPEEALRWYERCRRLLGDELGLDPSPQTSQLQRDILASRVPAEGAPAGRSRLSLVDGDHPASVPGPGSPTAPTTGELAAVAARYAVEAVDRTTAAAAPFFGRDTEIDLILSGSHLPVVHVVGPIGAGKSALLAELARRAPGRVGVGRGPGSAAALRLTWLYSALSSLGGDADLLGTVDRAMSEGRSLAYDELARVAALLDRPTDVVIAIDDAEGLDEGSVTELNWLRHRRGRLRVVLAYRYPSAIVGTPVATLDDGAVLRLAPLTGPELAAAGRPELFERTGGIPALVAAESGPPEVAGSVAMHVARVRTRWMPSAGWDVLRLTATLGTLRIEQVCALTGLPVAEVLEVLDQLVHAHLIVDDPSGLIRHSSTLVRDAVAGQVSGVHTRHMRRRLATSA
jgi:DNA-binding SARP family transcriptional activator